MKRVALFSVLVVLMAACGSNTDQPAPAPAQPQVRQPVPPPPEPAPVAQVVALEIEGMHCENCVAGVKQILESIEGVQSAEVSLETHSAKVTVKPGATFNREAARDKLEIENFVLKPAVTAIED